MNTTKTYEFGEEIITYVPSEMAQYGLGTGFHASGVTTTGTIQSAETAKQELRNWATRGARQLMTLVPTSALTTCSACGTEHDRDAMACPSCSGPTGAAYRFAQESTIADLVSMMVEAKLGQCEVTFRDNGKVSVRIDTELVGWELFRAVKAVETTLAAAASRIDADKDLAGYGDDFLAVLDKSTVVRSLRKALGNLTASEESGFASDLATTFSAALDELATVNPLLPAPGTKPGAIGTVKTKRLGSKAGRPVRRQRRHR